MPESCLYRLWVFDSKNAISFANTAMQTIITGDVNFGNETSKSSCWKPKKHPLVSYHSGDKRYEITNHLGKVQAVLSDRVLVVSQGLKDFGGIPANAAGLTADSGTPYMINFHGLGDLNYRPAPFVPQFPTGSKY